ncbi:MAG: MIP family channel protein [Candidatus Limnocylindrales bacterium]
MRAHLAEGLGTFALVFFGCGAIAVGQLGQPAVALAFGLVIAVMIYALGHISGAHFNPAVSVGFAIGRHFPWSRVATYGVAQVTGATLGALVLRISLGDGADLGLTQPSGTELQALTWEALLTFFLMLVITAVATDTRAVGEAAALAIGGTVALGALVGGPVSGASMNPARSLGPALVSADLTAIWLYLVGPVIGAIAAALVYRYLRGAPSPVAVASDALATDPPDKPQPGWKAA